MMNFSPTPSVLTVSTALAAFAIYYTMLACFEATIVRTEDRYLDRPVADFMYDGLTWSYGSRGDMFRHAQQMYKLVSRENVACVAVKANKNCRTWRHGEPFAVITSRTASKTITLREWLAQLKGKLEQGYEPDEAVILDAMMIGNTHLRYAFLATLATARFDRRNKIIVGIAINGGRDFTDDLLELIWSYHGDSVLEVPRIKKKKKRSCVEHLE